MKISPLLFLPMLLAACASRHPTAMRTAAQDVPGTALPGKGVGSVRYAENIKAYPLGRYIDPNNSRIMHEGHSIYRVETTAKWNLHPNEPVPTPYILHGPFHIRDSARTTSPVGDELVAQLNQQKEATRAIMHGGEVVSQKLGELSGKLQQTQEIAAQNALLKQEMSTTKQRLNALEKELRKQQATTTVPAKIRAGDKSDKPEW